MLTWTAVLVWIPMTGYSLSVMLRSEHQGWASVSASAVAELEEDTVVSLVPYMWLDQVLDRGFIVERSTRSLSLFCCTSHSSLA